MSRQVIHSYKYEVLVLFRALTPIDMCHTLLGLQHDFCTVWNELVQEARNRGDRSLPVLILRRIRRLYITLRCRPNCVLRPYRQSRHHSV